jgi:DNA mismatch endonuclease (patch repair protein)
MGYRFRVNRKDLPGTPDIVLPKHCCVVIANGYFWHRHSGCKRFGTPKSNHDDGKEI